VAAAAPSPGTVEVRDDVGNLVGSTTGTEAVRDALALVTTSRVGDTVPWAISIGAGGAYRMTILDSGRAYGRIALDVTLHDGADFQLGAILIGRGAQTIELVTTVRHVGPDATSRQIVRAVAGGTATTSYLGQVAVAREGQKTDASQSFKAILLNRGATANAKPELEIFADDVKCAHGAAIGEIDNNALFYMTSRGVPPAQARALLTRAFLSDAIEGLDDATTEALDAEITALLETAA
jgi:Fe-S cluster assembly protein SufD